VQARRPNQSPKDENAIACQSFLNAGIASTFLDTDWAGAAGYGSDMV
jgi:hypothetical protein